MSKPTLEFHVPIGPWVAVEGPEAGVVTLWPIMQTVCTAKVQSEFAAKVHMEHACARAQHYGETTYPAIKHILEAGLDQAALPAADPLPEPGRYAFVRQVTDFVASLAGAGR